MSASRCLPSCDTWQWRLWTDLYFLLHIGYRAIAICSEAGVVCARESTASGAPSSPLLFVKVYSAERMTAEYKKGREREARPTAILSACLTYWDATRREGETMSIDFVYCLWTWRSMVGAVSLSDLPTRPSAIGKLASVRNISLTIA